MIKFFYGLHTLKTRLVDRIWIWIWGWWWKCSLVCNCGSQIRDWVPNMLLPPSHVKCLLWLFGYLMFNFDLKFYHLCFIILDAKYMNKLGINYIFICIIFIKYYITQIKIFAVKIEQKRLKKVKVDTPSVPKLLSFFDFFGFYFSTFTLIIFVYIT